jgi:hypothetical protein
VYGPYISMADLKNWPRHRKALAAPFNENIMKFVLNESFDQAKQILAPWTTTAAVSNGILQCRPRHQDFVSNCARRHWVPAVLQVQKC